MAQQFGVGGTVVDVGGYGRIVDRDIRRSGLRYRWMTSEACAVMGKARSSRYQWACDQYRMAVLALKGGDGNRCALGVEMADQFFKRGAFEIRMIYRHEHYRFGFLGNSFQAALQRTEHATLRIRIHHETAFGAPLDAGLNFDGVMAQHDDRRDRSFGKQADQPIQESFAIQWKQRFRASPCGGMRQRTE